MVFSSQRLLFQRRRVIPKCKREIVEDNHVYDARIFKVTLLYHLKSGCCVGVGILRVSVNAAEILQTDLAEHCESLFVLWWAPSCSRIFPVQVQPVKAMQSQETDRRLDESLAVGRG